MRAARAAEGGAGAGVIMLIIRLYGALLTIGSLGACADEGVGPETTIMMFACGITCLVARDGLPVLRAVGALLTLAAIGMVGDGGFAQKVAVAVMAAAVIALRTEFARCLVCGADDDGRDNWRFCARCGVRRGKRQRG